MDPLPPAVGAKLQAHQEPLMRAARLLTGDWERGKDLLVRVHHWAQANRATLEPDTAPAGLLLRQALLALYLTDPPDAAPDTTPPAAEAAGPHSRTNGTDPAAGDIHSAANGTDPDASAADRAAGGTDPAAGDADSAAGGTDSAAGAAGGTGPAAGDAESVAGGTAGGARPAADGAGAEADPDTTGAHASLTEALAVLTPRSRVIAVGRYYLSLSPVEIGRVVDGNPEEVGDEAVAILGALQGNTVPAGDGR